MFFYSLFDIFKIWYLFAVYGFSKPSANIQSFLLHASAFLKIFQIPFTTFAT